MWFFALFACTTWPTPETPTHPLDDVLTFDAVQAKGTHNSYHVDNPDVDVLELNYEHDPFVQQLGEQGVRHFELDVDYDAAAGHFRVRHIPVIDELSQCPWLTDCFAQISSWSRFNPEHAPVTVLLEIKAEPSPNEAAAWFAALESDILAGMPAEQLLVPDDVQKTAPTLAAGVLNGWPTLGEVRGTTLAVLYGSAQLRAAYTENDTTVAGRLLFPMSRSVDESPVAVVQVLDDATALAPDVAAALAAHHLVRVRADGWPTHDATEVANALASGAQLISTDWPIAVDGDDYVFTIPGGTPFGCSPVTAPADCTPEAIEDPRWADTDGPGPLQTGW